MLDHHSASRSDPLYDLGARDWAHDWAEELSAGVPLPRLVWPTKIVGEVTAEAAAATAEEDWTVERVRLRPDPEVRETYERSYGIWRALYPATADLSHDLARIQAGGRP